jgi:hypothetical protein
MSSRSDLIKRVRTAASSASLPSTTALSIPSNALSMLSLSLTGFTGSDLSARGIGRSPKCNTVIRVLVNDAPRS